MLVIGIYTLKLGVCPLEYKYRYRCHRSSGHTGQVAEDLLSLRTQVGVHLGAVAVVGMELHHHPCKEARAEAVRLLAVVVVLLVVVQEHLPVLAEEVTL